MSLLTGFEPIVRQGEPLAQHTWFRLGGTAEYFAEPRTIDELQALVRRCTDDGIQFRLLGGGSNVLVRDEGVPGMVVSLPEQAFGAIATNGRKITAGIGAKLGHFDLDSCTRGIGRTRTAGRRPPK